MIDIFGIKAKRRVTELEKDMAEFISLAANTRIEKDSVIKGQGNEISFLNNQLNQARAMATQMRDRVRSHGKTEAEQEFIDVCINIYQNGKRMSQHRFDASVGRIIQQRESLSNAVGVTE